MHFYDNHACDRLAITSRDLKSG